MRNHQGITASEGTARATMTINGKNSGLRDPAAVCGEVVAACHDRRSGQRSRASALVRGRALGAFLRQLPAVAFRVCARRDAALPPLLRTAERGQPALVRPRWRIDRGAVEEDVR